MVAFTNVGEPKVLKPGKKATETCKGHIIDAVKLVVSIILPQSSIPHFHGERSLF